MEGSITFHHLLLPPAVLEVSTSDPTHPSRNPADSSCPPCRHASRHCRQAVFERVHSFNQSKDGVFYWRDFLKLMCHPLPDVLPQWPTSPLDLRKAMGSFSKHTKYLFLMLMEAVLESLGLVGTADEDDILKEFDDGSQLMIVNCYPPCPEHNLTLGMPPHSDYGFLTLLLQDEVEGLQIQHEGKWLTVEPIPNSFVVHVGDHLEIFPKHSSLLSDVSQTILKLTEGTRMHDLQKKWFRSQTCRETLAPNVTAPNDLRLCSFRSIPIFMIATFVMSLFFFFALFIYNSVIDGTLAEKSKLSNVAKHFCNGTSSS